MERSVLIINNWNLFTTIKKKFYITVGIVSIYKNVELFSDVDKINAPKWKNNSDIMLKSYDVSSVLWV